MKYYRSMLQHRSKFPLDLVCDNSPLYFKLNLHKFAVKANRTLSTKIVIIKFP